MATGVGLSSLADTLKRLTLNTPYRVQAPGLYLLCKLSYSQYVLKFEIFVTMATGVGLSKVWVTPLNWPTLKTPTGCKYLDHISYACWIIAHYVLKITNFRYHGNRGRSELSLSGTLKSADLYPPTGCKYLGHISYACWVITHYVLKITNFGYHGNRCRSEQFGWHP